MGLDWYEQPPYYITAYEYAVKAGYEGTEEEFAAGVARSATAADDAEAAAADAVAAQEAAETAQGKAEDAQDAAETAQGKAEDAQEAAETAQGKAEDAQEAAETAQGKAEDAQEAAETAAATFETDTTLSVEGKAADAAATGEKAAEIKQDLHGPLNMYGHGKIASPVDIDDLSFTGHYFVNGDSDTFPLNWPIAADGRLIVFGSDTETFYTKTQIAMTVPGDRLMYRIGHGGEWGQWKQVWNLDDSINILFPEYDETSTYEPNDRVVRRNSMGTPSVYRCKSSITTPESWNADHWSIVDNLLASSFTLGTLIGSNDNLDNMVHAGTYWYVSTNVPQGAPTEENSRVVIIGSESTTTARKVQLIIDETLNLYYRIGLGANWSNWFDLNQYNQLIYRGFLSEYAEVLEWEYGSFNTSRWEKVGDGNTLYARLKTTVNLKSIRKIRVNILDEKYRVYVGCKGQSAAVYFNTSRSIDIEYQYMTELNLTVMGHTALEDLDLQDVYNNIKLWLYPAYAESKEARNAIFDEINGLFLDGTPLKIGLYGASIVRGHGVSDFASMCTGDMIDTTEIGYTYQQRKYMGDLSWGRKLEAYLTANYPNVTVENWAIAGTTASTYFDILRKSKMNNNNPCNLDVDVAIIMMGNNGRKNSMETNIQGFSDIINLFLESGTHVFFMTPTAAYDVASSFILNTYQIMQCSKIAADKCDVSSIDAFHWIQDYCDIKEIPLNYDASAAACFLNSDRLHPSDLGHEIIFKSIRSLLKI